MVSLSLANGMHPSLLDFPKPFRRHRYSSSRAFGCISGSGASDREAMTMRADHDLDTARW